jgi:Rieske Fe-S protein
MIHGPFTNWDHAVAECCTKRGLLIVFHQWDGGKLYVEAVPHPGQRR